MSDYGWKADVVYETGLRIDTVPAQSSHYAPNHVYSHHSERDRQDPRRDVELRKQIE